MTTQTDDRSTADEIAPTFPPCEPWCPGHVDREVDISQDDSGAWVLTCSAPSGAPAIYGRDPDRFEYLQVSWGANTPLGGAPQLSIRIDSAGQQDLTVKDARLLAAHLLGAADAMEAAQR